MSTSRIPPLSYTVLSLSSYLLTHGTSSASPRAIAYANLAMNALLVMSENPRVMDMLCGQAVQPIRLCRQVCYFEDCQIYLACAFDCSECRCYPCHPQPVHQFVHYSIAVCYGFGIISINTWKCTLIRGSCLSYLAGRGLTSYIETGHVSGRAIVLSGTCKRYRCG